MENEPEPLRDADENKTNFIQTSEKENDTTDEETKVMTQNEIDNDQREDENAIESESVTDQENYVDTEPEPFGDNIDDDPEFIPTSEDESDRDEETNNMENETDNDQREEENVDTETEPVIEQGKPRKRIRNEAGWEVTKRQKATLAGKEHVSKLGKNISAKKIRRGCGPCRKKCTDKINELNREQIFNNYLCFPE
ncbi:unnamed protein product [Psylliodes chrysocephalus]|uniref:Uncharacterized protein n=1 Tax=Psylliodes chrysocephalus TaxID=3402493 RepID=A0A9P0D8D9_9CUCU|nr:unnamed protein product [Psylliodes chrysocephala]